MRPPEPDHTPADAPGDLHPTAWALLQALAAQPAGQPVSLPRLGKQLGQGASVLMRWLALMGEADLGGGAGPGWVVLTQAEGRWMAGLTEAGRAFVQAAAPPPAGRDMSTGSGPAALAPDSGNAQG